MKKNPFTQIILQSPDSKIRVHELTCMIALLLVRIAHKRARAKWFEHGAQRMLELFSSVNTAIVLYGDIQFLVES
jgi:hypothetical protein